MLLFKLIWILIFDILNICLLKILIGIWFDIASRGQSPTQDLLYQP